MDRTMDSSDGQVAGRSPVDEVVSQIGGDPATALCCEPYGAREETGGKKVIGGEKSKKTKET